MTLFANNKVECFVVSEGNYFPLKAVTISSVILDSVSTITQQVSSTSWQKRIEEFSRRQLQVRIEMLNHNGIAENMLQNAALEGSAINICFKLNEVTSLQAMMHIQQYNCSYTQNELDLLRLRAVSVGDVLVIKE